ncbi:aspartate aminotransferase [Fibrobacterales bacterium]|nr:aspartate aminotransferase [Fibrobacterales bacterium]
METYIQELFAERIGGNKFGKDTVLYKFEKIKRARREAATRRPDLAIIDMGVGEPDWMADDLVIERLNAEAPKWENRDYADNGIDTFKQAAAAYLEKVYGVKDINAMTEINHSIGSKPALAMMAQAFINPGDVCLMTVPGYPIMATMTSWLGGSVHKLPLKPENNFLPDLSKIPADVLSRAKLLYINYPNNPTGAIATEKFFEEVIEFARKNKLVVVQDAAYSALTFDDCKPLSFLSIAGAKEVGVEIHSLSKAFNMTGWRLGFVAGNEKVVKAFATVKDNNDSGQFKAVQLAGATALSHTEITEKTTKKYSRRHSLLVETLNAVGFKALKPKATFYLYCAIPRSIRGADGQSVSFANAEEFSQWLILEHHISTVPWDDAGNFVRFSVTYKADTEEDEIKIMDDIKIRLSKTEFVW